MDHKAFIKLTEELKAGDNKALKEVFQANSAYCISKLIAKFRCFREDAEDIYTDSILNFRDKLISGKIEFQGDLRNYLYATCKNMFLVKLKRDERTNKAHVFSYEDHYAVIEDVPDVSYIEEIYALMEKALRSLPEKCHDLLVSFYFEKLSLNQIAEKFEMANSNVAKVSKARCFKKLVDLVKAEQKKIQNVVE